MAEQNEAAQRALARENQFLAGVRASLDAARGSRLKGSIWKTVELDQADALRAMMAKRRMYDRSLLERLPHNRQVTLQGYEPRWFFWRRPTGAAVASVVSPLDELLDGHAAPPMDLNALHQHLQRIAPNPKQRYVVGVCSTSGFSTEARAARLERPNLTVVLIEPAAGGGWQVTAADDTPAFVRELFDPEDDDQKAARVEREVERLSADLLTGSISAAQVSRNTQIEERVVTAVLEEIAGRDAELYLSRQSDDALLYRGAPASHAEHNAKERRTMSFVDRIRELFSREGDEVNKINLLSERRAALAQRRDRLYEEIGKLEAREADLLQQGKDNTSQVVRRRLAAQVAQMRKDIARQNTTAQMLNQQLNIISTDIHNLTLIQHGEMAALPTTEELTENAVKAEEMLETLRSDADLVAGLETGIGEVLASADEMAVLAEFEAADAGQASAPPPARASRHRAAESSADASAEVDPASPAPPAERRPADPEAS